MLIASPSTTATWGVNFGSLRKILAVNVLVVLPELGRKLVFDFLRGEAQLAACSRPILSELLNQHVITCVMEALATLHRYKIYWQQRDNVTPHLAP